MGAQAYLVNTGGVESGVLLHYDENHLVPSQPSGRIFYRGTKQHIFTFNIDPVTFHSFLEAWQSTDGKNWTAMDHANRPSAEGSFSPLVSVPASGNICTLYRYDVSGQEFITTFDLSGAGSWGTSVLSPYNTRDPGIIVRGNGDIVLAYSQNVAPQNAFISVFSGGTWTDFPIGSLQNVEVIAMTLDAADRVQMFFSPHNGIGSDLWHVVFDGATVTVNGPILSFADNWTMSGPCLYLPGADKIILPLTRSDDGSGNPGLTLLIGSPASSASPTFALTNVLTDPDFHDDWKAPNLVMGATESDLTFVWFSKQAFPSQDRYLLQVISTDGGATWPGTALVFYDPLTDLPVPNPPNTSMDWLAVTWFQGSFRSVLSFGLSPFGPEVYVLTAPLSAGGSYAHTRGALALAA